MIVTLSRSCVTEYFGELFFIFASSFSFTARAASFKAFFRSTKTKQQGYERTLFNKTKQYNIQIFDKNIFFKYRTRQIKATETNK